MTGYNLAGFLIFAFVATITPGPNNFLLLSYGKIFGFKDSGRLMLGILSGFLVLLYISGYGIAGIVTRNNIIGLIIKITGTAWLFYLALLIRRLSLNTKTVPVTKLGFVPGFLMQFVNPKAWIIAISAAGTFMPQTNNIHLNVSAFAITFGLVGIPCMIIWVFMGDIISKVLKHDFANKIIGYTLFFLMMISIVMIWL